MGVLALAVVAVAIIACKKEKESKVSQNNSELIIVSKEEDMNYYLSKGPELLNHYKPEGMVVIDAYYQSQEIVGVKESNCYHELVVTYGNIHCNNNGGDY